MNSIIEKIAIQFNSYKNHQASLHLSVIPETNALSFQVQQFIPSSPTYKLQYFIRYIVVLVIFFAFLPIYDDKNASSAGGGGCVPQMDTIRLQ